MTVPSSWENAFIDDREVPEYIGMTRSEAEERAAQNRLLLRVIDVDENPEPVVTADLRGDRVTLLIRDGRVERAGWLGYSSYGRGRTVFENVLALRR